MNGTYFKHSSRPKIQEKLAIKKTTDTTKKKILYVTESIAPYWVGGMQAVAQRHVEYLRHVGHEVVVLHSRIEGNASEKNDTNLIRLPWPGDNNRTLRYPGRYANELKAYSQIVAQWVGKVNPDVIYAEGPVVYALLDKSNRPPIIFHPHGLEVLQTYSNWLDYLRLFALKRLVLMHCKKADWVISQGGRLTQLLTDKAGSAPDNVVVLPNSVGQLTTKVKPHSTGRFLFVGRAEKRKGLKCLLDIFSEQTNLRLDVVGSDAIPGVPSNVTFHGVVRDKEILLTMYHDAHVLIVPSLSEGMPTVILEAMSQGTPVIASDVGACSELVVSGDTGWCIKPGIKKELASAIIEATTLTGLKYDVMSKKCIALIKHHFSDDKVGTMLSDLIDRAPG